MTFLLCPENVKNRHAVTNTHEIIAECCLGKNVRKCTVKVSRRDKMEIKETCRQMWSEEVEN